MLQKHISETIVLSVISGTLLLFANINQLIDVEGILVAAVALISVPIILTVSLEKKIKINKILLLIMVFFPIFLINYIYYIKFGLPVGFQDAHAHIIQYEHLFYNGSILFSEVQNISFNFVGFYILHKFIEIISDMDIIWIATVLPPFINVLVTLTAYLFINRLFSFRVAIIAIMIFGWTDTVLLFGHEFRTQTIGTLFLFEILLVIAIFYYNKEVNSFQKTIIMLLLFGALAITSFISWIFAFIIFISILVAFFIFERKKNILITPLMIITFCVFFISYILYIGISLEITVTSMVNLLGTSFTNELSSPEIGQEIYGSFIRWFMYFFWGIFIIGSIYVLKEILFKKLDILKTVFFISFSTLFLFGFILSTSSFILNTARIYIVIMILIGTVIAVSILKLLSVIKPQRNKIFIKLLSTFFIILIISTSLAKFPRSIIGETQPIRDYTNIDDYNYWNVDGLDYTPASFSMNYIFNKTLNLHMIIKRHMFMSLYDQNKRPIVEILPENATFLDKFTISDIIILENSEQGKTFFGRKYYPPLVVYSSYFNQIYSNGDYQVFHYLT